MVQYHNYDITAPPKPLPKYRNITTVSLTKDAPDDLLLHYHQRLVANDFLQLLLLYCRCVSAIRKKCREECYQNANDKCSTIVDKFDTNSVTALDENNACANLIGQSKKRRFEI